MGKLLISIFAIVLAYYASRTYRHKTPIIQIEQLLALYDYIVVGSGSAGSVVAARLSELPNVTILVLEAGHDDLDFPYTQWMSMEQRLQLTDFDWKHETEPQAKCCDSLVNKRSKWPRGNGLGGCSSHNGAAHVRGSRFDYNFWEQKLGPKSGWSYEDVLPYFIKMENSEGVARLKGQQASHGFDGPIILTDTGLNPLAKTIVEAAQSLGLGWLDDINAMGGKEEQEGFSSVLRALGNGRRMGTAETYLRPAIRQRPNNIHVLTYAHVTRILIDDSNPELLPVATGVEFVHRGQTLEAKALQEVILSAGTVNSPQVLMLSGIGPKEELEKHSIKVLVDNKAVGQNLYDHVFLPLSATINNSDVSFNGADPNDWIAFTLAKMQYYLFRTGPLTQSPIEFTSFIRSGVTNEPWPDLQIYLIGSAIATPYEVFNLNNKASTALYPTNPETSGRKRVGFLPILLHPHNPGEIRLRSSDPFVNPIIDPKYLDNDYDVDILVKGLKICLQLIQSEEAKRYDMRLVGQHVPGCENLQLWSDAYLKCYVRSMLLTVYHPIGTCRMGKEDENNSVVDTTLRVHGIDHLRIVDASVFPYQVSANTNAPTLMVAEKAADMIKADYFSTEEDYAKKVMQSVEQENADSDQIADGQNVKEEDTGMNPNADIRMMKKRRKWKKKTEHEENRNQWMTKTPIQSF